MKQRTTLTGAHVFRPKLRSHILPKQRRVSAEPNQYKELEGDSLSSGVAFTMGITVAQRAVGFIRTAIFCRLLAAQELGQWSLVFSFVMFSAPMTMMGITGSFGRYVEHYLQRGLIKRFLFRTGAAVVGLTLLTIASVWFHRGWVSWGLFGSTEQTSLLIPACVTLVTTIAFNYFLEVVIALRQIKVGSMMSLISSWSFAVLGIGFLYCTQLGSYGVILAFAISNLLAAFYALRKMTRLWPKLPDSNEPFSHFGLWKKLAPFAIGLWIVNIFLNTFDLADRYMIIHFSGSSPGVAQGLVGQYFSSLAVPLLMVGVSVALAHMVMPYLSKDWEAGRFQAVYDRVNMSIKMIGLMLCVVSVSILIMGPFIFSQIFGGKYAAGFAILPWTITFCYWKAISTAVYNYLFCTERTQLMCVSLGIGLLANIALNALLLPILGLAGAAIATSLGCGINLGIALFFCRELNLKLHSGVFCVILFPCVFGLGTVAAEIALVGLLYVASCTTWFFSSEEREELEATLQGIREKLLPSQAVAETEAA